MSRDTIQERQDNVIRHLQSLRDNSISSVVTKPQDILNTQVWQETLRVLKPGAHILVSSEAVKQHRALVNVEDAGFEIRDIISHIHTTSSGETKIDLWTLARKPLKESTIAKNVLKYGTGGINVDASRVSSYDNEGLYRKPIEYEDKDAIVGMNASKKRGSVNKDYLKGRFPANVIHDGSKEVLQHFPHTKSGKMLSTHTRHTDRSPNGIYGKFDINHPLSETHGDEGSAARFFKEVSTKQELVDYLVNMITPPQGIVLDIDAIDNTVLDAAGKHNLESIVIRGETVNE